MQDWIDDALGALTLDEKIALLAGRNEWETVPIDRLGIPSLKVTDGPNGARGADRNHGPTSTSFPVGAAMGATFDPELVEQVGRALAYEARAKGADVLLAPTVNIPRVPIAGRNFECFSEDPILSGVLAAALIRGVQAEGVGACIKHFVCNDQEHERRTIDARVDDRTLREIYLEPFRIAVEQSQPWAAMSSYNSVNGVTASEHPLLEDILRGEFGFDGVVMSDWYGTYSASVVASGLDLEMPGPARWMDAGHVQDALDEGSIDEAVLDTKVRRLLTLMERTGAAGGDGPRAERADELDEHRRLARRVACDSVVLLENTSLLPLASPARVAVIGRLAAATPNQGGGSSHVNPHRVISILEGLEAQAPAGTEVKWAPGVAVHRWPPALDSRQVSHGEGTPGFLVEYHAGPEFHDDAVRALPTTKSLLIFSGHGDEWVDHEFFSVRMSTRFRPLASGRHVFSVSAGGRFRLWADGAIVVDAWESDAAGPASWGVELAEERELDLMVEYSSRPGERRRWLRIGCEPPTPLDPIDDACRLAAQSDVAVVVVGLTPEWESERFDRPDLKLPGEQSRLVERVAAAQPNTVVVVVAGSPVEMPWRHEVGAVLQAWYGGQEIGHAVADVLFGREDPGGRLPVTFPRDSRQHPGLLNYPGEAGMVRYGEGAYVGYRGFDRLGIEPMYAFGYGRSYTSFTIDDVIVDQSDGRLSVRAQLTNVGDRPGVEVVQVFVRDVGGVDRRLAGFEKCRLAEGESMAVDVPISPEHLRWWNPAAGGWTAATGLVEFEISGTFGTTVAATDLPAAM